MIYQAVFSSYPNRLKGVSKVFFITYSERSLLTNILSIGILMNTFFTLMAKDNWQSFSSLFQQLSSLPYIFMLRHVLFFSKPVDFPSSIKRSSYFFQLFIPRSLFLILIILLLSLNKTQRRKDFHLAVGFLFDFIVL